jgi:hypothetical protein
MNSVKRALTALAAGAIALPLLASPAAAAPGDTPIPPPQDIRTFCTNAFESQFTDLPPAGDANANELRLAVNCLASATTTTAGNNDTDVIARGNPQGIGADKYGPLLNVTRGQMASFIARLIDASSVRERADGNIRELPAPAAGNPFPGDVPNNFVHLNNIKRLSQAGIVNGNPGTAQQPNGIGADRFGPDLPVTRSQMASFINRAVAYATSNTAPANIARDTGNTIGFVANNAEFFVDPQQQVHERNVKGITSAGISQGVGGDRYDGLGNVTRQQMARFLSRTLSRLFGDADPFANRIFSVLESYTANFDDASRTDQNVATTRTLTLTGLNPATQYRITLVKCENVDRIPNDLVRFTPDGAFANTGAPTSRIIAGTAIPSADNDSTVAFTPAGGGNATFTITNDGGAECVVAVVYVNGGPGKSLSQGGDSPRLEVSPDGFPREFFGISGETRFTDAQQVDPVVDGEATVVVNEESVEAGDPFTGTVTGDQPITSVQVSGACIETTTLTQADDTDTDTPGIQFSIDTLADAAAGECVLTFVTTFENGTTDTDTDTVTITRTAEEPPPPTTTATTTGTTTGVGNLSISSFLSRAANAMRDLLR